MKINKDTAINEYQDALGCSVSSLICRVTHSCDTPAQLLVAQTYGDLLIDKFYSKVSSLLALTYKVELDHSIRLLINDYYYYNKKI